jgi:alpha/beta superfamily hydrolase
VNIVEIRASVELPSMREDISFTTQDGITLLGELATPIGKPARATLLTLHPLPTHGGFMDSHILRKAANRLPALADIAVLRFNTRGTESPRGKSQGEFDDGNSEKFDLFAALEFVSSRKLPNIWLVGWSFGTELALKYGVDLDIRGIILLSPPLHRTSDQELQLWVGSPKMVVAIVPEFDDYLKPHEAMLRFSMIPQARVVGVDGAKHLWVGESATSSVLNEIVKVVAPEKSPLPNSYELEA